MNGKTQALGSLSSQALCEEDDSKSFGFATEASCHALQMSLEERRGQETDGARVNFRGRGSAKGVHDMHPIIGSRLFDWILPRLMSYCQD